MKQRATILLVEDDTKLAGELRRVLEDEDYKVILAETGEKGLMLAEAQTCDLVITDFRLPGLNGMELVKRLRTAQPRLPVVLMTAHGTTEAAIEATKLGAYDYLQKPFDMPDLIELARKALASSRLMGEPVTMGDQPAARDALVGASRAMQEIYKEIGRVAAKPVTVLLRGETGTGKELLARAIYQHGGRTDKPFIAVNCAAIPETLIESELFGHERGAFTGADARRIGRFEQAHTGTIFLDEIGDMSPNTQVKLLRVIQEKCIQRLGGKETIPVDVRIIASTHRDLEKAMQEQQFREDLFYRLSVVVITLPPLRERREDIPALVHYFLRRFGRELGAERPSIQPEAIQFLAEQPWPGNVRELENAVRRALLLARGFSIGIEEVRQVSGGAVSHVPGASVIGSHVAELLAAASRGELENLRALVFETADRELFSQAIKRAQGNQAKAAGWLGVSRLTMREKLLQLGLHPRHEKENG
ncbi:MAG: sigma-54-dependent Fis family transcriptional regulator [Verrucomicrobia bacterium]|nr:sigma-54-dependent Fis family transcriptional regulator [Verrucomicrobiota bacterium]